MTGTFGEHPQKLCSDRYERLVLLALEHSTRNGRDIEKY